LELNARYEIRDTGFRMRICDARYQIPDTKYGILVLGFWMFDLKSREFNIPYPESKIYLVITTTSCVSYLNL